MLGFLKWFLIIVGGAVLAPVIIALAIQLASYAIVLMMACPSGLLLALTIGGITISIKKKKGEEEKAE